MQPSVYVLGDSHIWALWAAYHSAQNPLSDQERSNIRLIALDHGGLVDEFLLTLADGTEIFNPIVVKCLHDHTLYSRYTRQYRSGLVRVVFLFGYHLYHRIGLDAEWSRYTLPDVVAAEPSLPGETDGRYMIPRTLLREVMGDQSNLFFAGIARLKQETNWDLALLAGPPPHYDIATFLQKTRRNYAVDATTRLAVWRTLNDLVKDRAASIGVRHLDFSAEFTLPTGFLKPEYCGDGVHANPAYGASLLRRIYDFYEAAAARDSLSASDGSR